MLEHGSGLFVSRELVPKDINGRRDLKLPMLLCQPAMMLFIFVFQTMCVAATALAAHKTSNT